MFLKIVLSAYFICLVKAETKDEAIANLNQQIATTESNIDLTLKKTDILFNQARAVVSQAVEIAKSQVQDLHRQVHIAKNEAKQQAESNNTDISLCIKFLDGRLNFKILEFCTLTSVPNSIRYKTELIRLRASWLGSVGRCRAANFYNFGGLKSCVQSNIDKVNNQIQKLQSKIHDDCANVKKRGAECADQLLAKNQVMISDAVYEFQQCVAHQVRKLI